MACTALLECKEDRTRLVPVIRGSALKALQAGDDNNDPPTPRSRS